MLRCKMFQYGIQCAYIFNNKLNFVSFPSSNIRPCFSAVWFFLVEVLPIEVVSNSLDPATHVVELIAVGAMCIKTRILTIRNVSRCSGNCYVFSKPPIIILRWRNIWFWDRRNTMTLEISVNRHVPAIHVFIFRVQDEAVWVVPLYELSGDRSCVLFWRSLSGSGTPCPLHDAVRIFEMRLYNMSDCPGFVVRHIVCLLRVVFWL